MSIQTDTLDIKKCIKSRLWYTSLVIYQINNNDRSASEKSHIDNVDFIENKSLIKRLIYSSDNDQHCWITQVLLKELIGNFASNVKHVQKQCNHLQMACALRMCENVPLHVQQELLLLYDTNLEQTSFEVLKRVDQDCLLFLKNNIHKHPGLICWIINELIFMHIDATSNVNALQDFCFTIVKELLESQLSEQRLQRNDDNLRSVLCILSKVNAIECNRNEFSMWLLPMLMKTCNLKNIEFALYSREDKNLFYDWCFLLDELYARSKVVNNLDNALKVRDIVFRFECNHAYINKNELLQRIIKTKTHWFSDIMDICYILLLNGRYDDVSSILSCDLLKNVWPVLLFKILNDCSQEEIGHSNAQGNCRFICDAIKFLMWKCNFSASQDSTLCKLNATVMKHIKIMECALCTKKENFIAIDSNESHKESAVTESTGRRVSTKHIFFLLQHFNILTVLKVIMNMHEQDFSKVQNLLKELDEPKPVFQSYSSMLSALKAILLCDSYSTKHNLIASYFSNMKQQLQTLYPLSLRLTVIENIFSLLFLRYEDFSHTQNNSDDENISTSDEKSKSENKLPEQHLTGFICNKYAIRDMLLHLEESVYIIGIERATLKTKIESREDMDQIQRNISAIATAITDAKWRLELYTNSQFIENTNINEDSYYSTIIANKSEIVSNEKVTSNRLKENPLFYQDDSTSDETRIRSDSSSESGLLHNTSKWRRRTKHTPLISDNSLMKDASQKPAFVSFMLASKESLVIQCLWKSDYVKAQEIIEMSDMKNTQLHGEARFSKALHTFKQNAYKHVQTLKDEHTVAENSEPSTLENIRLAAQGGIQSSRNTSQLETFLASQEANLRMLNTDILKSNKMLTLCVLDLALTLNNVPSISNSLCDVAMKYLKLHKTFDSTEYGHFFCKIYQLLYENKNELSVTNILCDTKIPLSVKEYKERNDLWTNITLKYSEFKVSQANKNTINKILKDNNYLPGLKILDSMITIPNGSEKYLQNIYYHLQHLHTIIPTDDVILTVSDLLKVPLHYYFGHQIFDLRVEPNKLETIAQNLQVNLVYSILVNACPKFHQEKDTKYNINAKDNGCIILNKSTNNLVPHPTVQKPNQCVSEILTELLQVLYNLSSGQSSISYDTCKTISEHPDVQTVLSKTSRLTFLDLSELSVGDETLTFLLNTWNIMFLHACLTIWAGCQSFNSLQHAISLMSAGYVIGDLGLVTLAALRVRLLDNIMSDNRYFMGAEELNEPAWQDLDITYDPRVIFAMANEFHGMPRIQVYDAKSLSEDLTNAFYEYLDHYSVVCQDNSQQGSNKQKVMLLPDLVQQYQKFVLQSSRNNVQNSDSILNLSSVEDYMTSDVNYLPSAYSYDIVLEYSNFSNFHHRKKNDLHETTWKARTFRSSLLQYLEDHCWILSYILQRIHNQNPTILENNYGSPKRTVCLENLLNSSWITAMKPLFENNQAFAAIYETIPMQKLWSYFEAALENCNYHDCLKLINALPANVLLGSPEFLCLKDKILSYVASTKEDAPSTEILQYLYQIKDIHILAQTVLCNINKWHENICECASLHALHHTDSHKLPSHCKLGMNETLRRVLIFHKMLPYCPNKLNGTWYDVAYCTEKIDPFQIIRSLINADKFELCLEWLECQAFSLELQSSITQDFLFGLLKNESQNFKQASKLLQVLPLDQSVKMCKTVLKKLESIDALQFGINYLLEHCKETEKIKYRGTLVGIDILRMIETKERPLYIHLIKEPLLMLEQLLMNCKFESIQKILNNIRDKLEDVNISISSFDKIVRFYAQRSLDFRVSLQRDGIDRTRNIQHSISEVEGTEFVMPSVIPTREEWIPNDKARECSCCKTVIFSMFNRRHHCRRCGRVICAMCSQHRMQVPGYPPSVPVRVCDDCKQQTVLQMRAMQGTPSTASSEAFDYWRLTRDQKHNQTIREEFSFEYAPNISLCLAILNMHSEHKAYTSFLLDRCDEMKRLLQPVSGGKINPEVDHTVIIKMIRSLLVAAKVKCAKLGLNTGLAHCDRFLSQVDLIATLVQSDCLDLIPSDNLDGHALRKLRDLLIEKEQWTLALDVSTKAGLDTQGVWATWGKAYLKMGYFDQARDKFYHCLDKVQYEDFDDWVVLSCPKEYYGKKDTHESPSNVRANYATDTDAKLDESGSKKTEFIKNRPLKDPPLLTEILQILDNIRVYRQHAQTFYQYRSSTAQEILNTLGNLRITHQGQFAVKQLSLTTQEIHYQESLYYLLTYGSNNSILEFFLKHEEYDKCVGFALENDLDPDLFFNAIYMYCLKNGTMEKLHEAMKTKDSNLLLWKKYLIHVCHNLERRQYLHILYQLQLFMKDYVRAAMTCIRFYVNEANDYTDLCCRGNLLLDAQRHLESELQIGTLNRKRRKSTSSVHSGQGILTMEMEPLEIDRHINTICRQMEVAKFLGNCEKEGRVPAEFLSLVPDMDQDGSQTPELPTLFGNQQQKIHLAVLAILCGRDIEEGFGIAFRIMQDYNLPQQKVYSLVGHVLALKNNTSAIEQLIKCCHTSGTPNSHVISDYVLTHCVKLLLNRLYSNPESISKNSIDSLVKLITDIELKINAYIECKQLKAAYLLAVKYSRAQDIRRILKESDRLGQNAIRAICIKWLQQEPKK